MRKLTLSQGNSILDQCNNLFKKFNFNKSAKSVEEIKKELNGKKDILMLNSIFKVLQTTFIVEFSTTSHRTLCSDFFKRRVNLITKLNTSGLSNFYTDKTSTKMREYRDKARAVLFILDKILRNGAKSEEEKSISISYLYLSNADGVYGKNLKNILIFDMLSKLRTVNYGTIERMKRSKIEQYFQTVKDADCLFDGWNENIRNAIAHSSFWYDSKKSKIIFEDRPKSIVIEKTKDELLEMLNKLTDIDEFVFFYYQIFRINKVLWDLK